MLVSPAITRKEREEVDPPDPHPVIEALILIVFQVREFRETVSPVGAEVELTVTWVLQVPAKSDAPPEPQDQVTV